MIVTLLSIAFCVWLALVLASGHAPSAQVDTTGHRWDETLEEYNNPLPKWWSWLFYLTVVFALVYGVLYPTFGRFPGVFGWTSAGEHKKEVETVDAQVKPLFDKYLKMDLLVVAADRDAMEMGGRLFQTYCIQCHGATGQGSRDKGFPNLSDKTGSGAVRLKPSSKRSAMVASE